MEKTKKQNLVIISLIYLLGIFMGALDTGIITPARTIIQSNLGVDEKTGIWMITIYTLAYAASIPIMGKLADKFGRKYVYLFSIFLFGFGSLMCGLSQDVGSFSMLLIARAVQAIGGGGILPVATAEFGTTFPKEKRGLALGLVGGVYGIANIFGASAGSAVLDLFGKNNWQFIFYINVPITIFIMIAGFIALSNAKSEETKPIDFIGITILTGMVLSILYGLRNIDFFNLSNSIKDTSVYPFLIIFVVLLPVFIFAEKKAKDPVINLSYFVNPKIIITLFLAFVTGVVIMGMIFIPQFSENQLKITSGDGGYFVIILGIFAGISAPLSGKLIDKFGAKIVLTVGFAMSVVGSLFTVLVTTSYPSTLTVVLSLIFIGIGIGFTMGTPLNYMMLDNTKPEESNSALATLSLIRSIGTAIAPAIMIGFIAHAGQSCQTNIQNLTPKEFVVPGFSDAQDITDTFNKLKSDPTMSEKLKNIQIPDLTKPTVVDIDFSGKSNIELPQELVDKLKSSDVTTIVGNTKAFADYMLEKFSPLGIQNAQNGIQKGIDSMSSQLDGMDKTIVQMQAAYDSMTQNGKIKPNDKSLQMLYALEGIKATEKQIKDTVTRLGVYKGMIPDKFEQGKKDYISKLDELKPTLENEFQKTLNGGFQQVYLTVTVSSIIALAVLFFYKKKNEATVGEDIGIKEEAT